MKSTHSKPVCTCGCGCVVCPVLYNLPEVCGDRGWGVLIVCKSTDVDMCLSNTPTCVGDHVCNSTGTTAWVLCTSDTIQVT